MVRASGYLQGLEDFRKIPLAATDAGVSVRLGDVARVQVGPEMRRGIAELDGEGEVAGGIIVMRSGKNALETIEAVKAKIDSLRPGLPKGVEIVPTYDRSRLIDRAVANLREKLLEEFVVVALVCVLFLFHVRSAFVAIVSLPVGVLMAFIVMRRQGVNADIMSLGGIAIAVGAMVDAAVVMIENAHKHIEAWRHSNPGASSRAPSIGASWATLPPRWAPRSSSRCSSSRSRSCRCSPSRPRKGGCSLRSPTRRPTRWPRRRPSRSRSCPCSWATSFAGEFPRSAPIP